MLPSGCARHFPEMCVLELCVTSHLFPLAREFVQHQLPLLGPPPYFHPLPFFCKGACVLLSFLLSLLPQVLHFLCLLSSSFSIPPHTATLHSLCLPPTLSFPCITNSLCFPRRGATQAADQGGGTGMRERNSPWAAGPGAA